VSDELHELSKCEVCSKMTVTAMVYRGVARCSSCLVYRLAELEKERDAYKRECEQLSENVSMVACYKAEAERELEAAEAQRDVLREALKKVDVGLEEYGQALEPWVHPEEHMRGSNWPDPIGSMHDELTIIVATALAAAYRLNV
jgi:septal ring factor EnvC (AmiA/AmiB activator)